MFCEIAEKCLKSEANRYLFMRVTITQCEWSKKRSERIADDREIFGMLNIWTCRRFKILLCERSSDWKICKDLQPMREQHTGQKEVRGGVIWNVVCGPDRVVGDSSYCKVMQCVTYCLRSIVQCEHSSNWMLPQIVVQCKNNRDPTTLKIMLCELSISCKVSRICNVTQVTLQVRMQSYSS